MPNYVVDQAQIRCNAGSSIVKIKATHSDLNLIEEKAVAVQKDCQSFVNIDSFGSCAILRGNCTPQTAEWEQCSELEFIDDIPVLTELSRCACSVGGEISIIDTGVNDFVEEV